MDASQYKDYVLVILFIKYISDKAKDPSSMINLPEGCSFADMVKLKNKPGIGDAMNTIDLKLGSFKAQYKGQMELYLRWLEKYEMQPGEESPLGLLLCTEGSDEQISLLQLDKSGIRVVQYLTELPSKEVLLRQLQKSIEAVRENMPIENEKQ